MELVATGGPLADQLADIEAYPLHRGSVEVEDKESVMERVTGLVMTEYDGVDASDGARVELDDGWFLLRASGTQPLVRVTAEAREEERAGELFETARAFVDEAK